MKTKNNKPFKKKGPSLSIRLDEDMLRLLDKVAAQEGRNRSSLITYLLDKCLNVMAYGGELKVSKIEIGNGNGS